METLEGSRRPPAVFGRSPISDIRNAEARILLGEFLESQEFAFGVGKLNDFLRLKPGERTMSEDRFKELLVGFFFSNIAYGILKKGLKNRERLLSPQETDEFYDLQYPSRPKRNLYGLGLQIEGITIPDGILISAHGDKTVINRVYEYSLASPDNPGKSRQLDHYRNITEVIAGLTSPSRGSVNDIRFPEVIQRRFNLPTIVEVDPDNFEVVFVFPRNRSKDLYYSNVQGGEIFLPISLTPINIFLIAVFNDIRDSPGST